MREPYIYENEEYAIVVLGGTTKENRKRNEANGIIKSNAIPPQCKNLYRGARIRRSSGENPPGRSPLRQR